MEGFPLANSLLSIFSAACLLSQALFAESFFHSLKTEWTAEIIYRIRSDARGDVIQYIEIFYNSNRLHSYWGYKNPNYFEKNFILAKAA